jgi:Zn-dependent peptidase ImmA (M78 family)
MVRAAIRPHQACTFAGNRGHGLRGSSRCAPVAGHDFTNNRIQSEQAKGRIRFSIAHEIAHTFFPDFSERVRNREDTKELGVDREVEFLCNIAAAEIVMPVGSFREVLSEPLDTNEIMNLRHQLDVSTEALLLATFA